MTKNKFSPLIATIIALCSLVAIAGVFCGHIFGYSISANQTARTYTDHILIFSLPDAKPKKMSVLPGLCATIFAFAAILCIVALAVVCILKTIRQKQSVDKLAFWFAILTIAFSLLSIACMIIYSSLFTQKVHESVGNKRTHDMYYGAFMIYCSCILAGIFYLADCKKDKLKNLLQKTKPSIVISFGVIAGIAIVASLFLTHTANGIYNGASLWQTKSSFKQYLFFYAGKTPFAIVAYVILAIMCALTGLACIVMTILTFTNKNHFKLVNTILATATFVLSAGLLCGIFLNCNLRIVFEMIQLINFSAPGAGFYLLFGASLLSSFCLTVANCKN